VNESINFLNDDELTELTGYKQKAKRQMALAKMNVSFKVNPRGRILVKRDVIAETKRKKTTEPDWSAMKGAA